jgi:hypothetical protein
MEYVFTFGKFKGESLDDLDLVELDSYFSWMTGLDDPSNLILEAIDEVQEYLGRREIQRVLNIRKEQKLAEKYDEIDF